MTNGQERYIRRVGKLMQVSAIGIPVMVVAITAVNVGVGANLPPLWFYPAMSLICGSGLVIARALIGSRE